MKILDGRELAGYIKERQAKQVRSLRQGHGIFPKLAIVKTVNDPVIETYVHLKQRYGADIQAEVAVHHVSMDELPATIQSLNADDAVHGIIMQLPLADQTQTEVILNQIDKFKDVDGLCTDAVFDPATPMAIIWLLNGYNVELAGKKIVLLGKGRLVGAPLEAMLRSSGYDVTAYDDTAEDIHAKIRDADILVTATGQPSLVRSEDLRPGVVAIDAGVAIESGRAVGDFADDVYEREDITITPRRGGVGPLTVCALFDNLIRSAQTRIPTEEE